MEADGNLETSSQPKITGNFPHIFTAELECHQKTITAKTARTVKILLVLERPQRLLKVRGMMEIR